MAGERLELARLGRLTDRRRVAFVAAAGLFGAGVVAATWLPDARDPARRRRPARRLPRGSPATTSRAGRSAIPGVTRFIALCLLAGYAWLAVGGATWLVWGAAAPALARDAMLHALFLGFVISMVYGHAPVILPAVLRVPLPYRPWFYGHLALLQAGLVVRVVRATCWACRGRGRRAAC